MFGQNSKYKIKTKNGWESFTGIQKLVNRKTCNIVLEDGKTLDCTPDHRLNTVHGFLEVRKLFTGDVVQTTDGFKKIISIIANIGPEDVYDILDAGIDRSYFTNGILSHNCEFIGSTNTLINPAKIRSMVFKAPVANDGYLKIYEQPIKTHTYISVVDVAEGQGLDYSTFSVIDVTEIPYKQVAVYRNNKITPYLFPTMIVQIAMKYNQAYILVEINSIGLQVADIINYELSYDNLLKFTLKGRQGQFVSAGHVKKTAFGIKTSTQTKKIGCAHLKTLIEGDKLIINDADTIMEFTTFSSFKDTFKAEEGSNDDVVMGLVNFGWVTGQRVFKDNIKNDIRQNLQMEQLEVTDQDVVPFGIIDNGLNDPLNENVDASGDLWVEDRTRQHPFDDFNWMKRGRL